MKKIFYSVRNLKGIGISILSIATIFALYQNCGGSSDGGGVSSQGLESGATTGGGTTGTSSTATFRLINSTGLNINFAHISSSTSTTWGPNLLSSDLANGSSMDFPGFSPGTYDGRAVIVANSIYNAYIFGAAVSAGSLYSVTSTPSAYSGSLIITNGSPSLSITELYLALPSDPTWGLNQISSNVSPGGSIHLYDLAPNNLEMLVVWSNGASAFFVNVGISPLTLTTGTANP